MPVSGKLWKRIVAVIQLSTPVKMKIIKSTAFFLKKIRDCPMESIGGTINSFIVAGTCGFSLPRQPGFPKERLFKNQET
jgi:hypothetical protein